MTPDYGPDLADRMKDAFYKPVKDLFDSLVY
jgi:hypothetical protein